MNPGEEKLVRLEIITLPISYGDLQIGLHEDGEVGDDLYGDIIIKEENTNCGAVADIYRSTAPRSYQEGITSPSCEFSDIDIGNTFPELTDSDGNGVPDYLQDLLAADDIESIKEYADEANMERNKDSDSDGIPDRDDAMDNTNGATDFMGALSEIDEKAGEIAEEIDTLVE